MNPEQLRQDLRDLWLSYYRDNRHWLSRLEIWITYNHQRRPSSSFILATVSVLNPQLTQILPLLVDLNHDPDQMVEALGLNFNPEEALGAIARDPALAGTERSHQLPSAGAMKVELASAEPAPETMPATASTPAKKTAPGSQPESPPSASVLERPSRPIPRQGGKQPMAEVTSRANTADADCEGRARPPRLARPRRRFVR